MEKLNIFIKRLSKIDITIEVVGNRNQSLFIPWIYLDKINGEKVIEKYQAEHGFTIGWYPTKPGKEFEFTDLKEIFKIIRKYGKK